jgi:hypothetical protein
MVLAGILAGTAQARVVAPPPGGWGAAEFEAAKSYWGGAEPVMCSTLRITFDTATVGHEAAADATTPVQFGTPCVMDIRRAVPGWRSQLLQCLSVVHEYGHLLGYGHSPERSSIMYHELLPKIQRVPQCEVLALGSWN